MQEGTTRAPEEEGGFKIIEIRAPDLPAPHTRDHCRKCSCVNGYLGRYIQSNGSVAVRWVCDWCEDYGTAGDLPKAFVAMFGVVPAELPLRINRSLDDRDYLPKWDPCVVCDAVPTEQHHWAPLSIFGDWPFGLTAALCAEHHREWHEKMRAHGLRWPSELVDAT